MMETSKSADIVGNAAAILLGLPVAFVIALPFRWLWPEMAMPMFFIILLCWLIAGTTMVIRGRAFKTKSSLSPEGYQSDRRDYIVDLVLAIVFGVVPAAFLGGAVGFYRAWLRWPVFAAVLVLWIAVAVSVVLQDRRSVSHTHEKT